MKNICQRYRMRQNLVAASVAQQDRVGSKRPLSEATAETDANVPATTNSTDGEINARPKNMLLVRSKILAMAGALLLFSDLLSFSLLSFLLSFSCCFLLYII